MQKKELLFYKVLKEETGEKTQKLKEVLKKVSI